MEESLRLFQPLHREGGLIGDFLDKPLKLLVSPHPVGVAMGGGLRRALSSA